MATAADAEALAALARRTFEDTFRPDNDPEDMDAYVSVAFAVERIASELNDGASTYFVAERPDGALTGYAKLRSGGDEPAIQGQLPIELQRIYVDAPALETGLGARLMERCLAEAFAAGYRTIWLGVWERNPRAIAFYERWGFRRVGEHAFLVGKSEQTDWLMERSLVE